MLLDVSVLFGGDRSQRAEQAMRFAIGTGREEQRGGWTSRGVVSEGQRPQSIDDQNRTVRIVQEADELASEAVVCRDLAAAEIAHEYGIAEETEIARRPNDSPRCAQPLAVLEMAEVPASRLVQFDEAKAIASDIIVLSTVLHGVGDEEGSTDVLDVEWSEVARNRIVIEEFFGDIHALEGS